MPRTREQALAPGNPATFTTKHGTFKVTIDRPDEIGRYWVRAVDTVTFNDYSTIDPEEGGTFIASAAELGWP